MYIKICILWPLASLYLILGRGVYNKIGTRARVRVRQWGLSVTKSSPILTFRLCGRRRHRPPDAAKRLRRPFLPSRRSCHKAGFYGDRLATSCPYARKWPKVNRKGRRPVGLLPCYGKYSQMGMWGKRQKITRPGRLRGVSWPIRRRGR